MVSLARSLAFLLVVAVALPLSAGRRRAAAPVINTLSIEFVRAPEEKAEIIASGSDVWVDAQAMTQKAGSAGRPLRVERRFGVRVRATGPIQPGTATITARLMATDGRSSIRIDGLPLTQAERIVVPRAPVGVTTLHTIEIEVSETAAEGALMSSIVWEATTE